MPKPPKTYAKAYFGAIGCKTNFDDVGADPHNQIWFNENGYVYREDGPADVYLFHSMDFGPQLACCWYNKQFKGEDRYENA